MVGLQKTKLIQKIKKDFPKLKFSEFKQITCGFDHIILILDNKYIFRFPRDSYYKKKIKIEMKLLGNLQDSTHVSIPNYKFVVPDKSYGGYRLIQGTRLTKTAFNKLNKKSQKKLAKDLSNFLTGLHTITLTEAEEIGLVHEWTITDQIKEFNKRKRFVYSTLSRQEKIFIGKFIKKWAALSMPKKLSPIHFDLTGDHILIDKNKLAGIIDFGDSAIGDPASDFAWLWTYEEKFVHNVYDNYKGKRDKNLLHRSKLHYFATLLSSLYHGVKDGKKQQVKITLKTIRRIMESRFLNM